MFLGQWKGNVPLPPKTSFASLANALTGYEKDMFVSLMDFLVDWLPEGRVDAMHMFYHPFIGNKRPNKKAGEGEA
ncbi:hypothetical protein F4859DRAFT_491850 [Xylaria cf. heliscus]|nr:hypothetical protein F4859DRAFT_491850 [Xylaria cf. heliscus]